MQPPKIPIDATTNCITFPPDFCNLTTSKEELIQKVFSNIDVNEINMNIQFNVPEEATTYKSIDTVMEQEEAVNYPTEFLRAPRFTT